MPRPIDYASPQTPRDPGDGISFASVVLGSIACLITYGIWAEWYNPQHEHSASFTCSAGIFGVTLGVAGLVAGGMAISRGSHRAVARAGLIASGLGTVGPICLYAYILYTLFSFRES